MAPDRPDIWLRLGDHVFHEGLILAIPNFREQAAAAFDSALALGEFTPEAQRHLDEIRFDRGDAEFIQGYLDRPDKPSAAFDPLHWAGAWMLGDSALIDLYGGAIDTLPGDALHRMLRYSKYFVTGFPHADLAAIELEDRGGTPGVEAPQFYSDLSTYQLNRGRPEWTERLYRARYGGDRALVANRMLLFVHFPTWPLGQPPVDEVISGLDEYSQGTVLA